MKITDNSLSIKLDVYTKNIDEKKNSNRLNRIQDKEVLKEDRVLLSPVAKKINILKKTMESIPDRNEQKMAQIKMEVNNGTYQVKDKMVAGRMLRESLLNEWL